MSALPDGPLPEDYKTTIADLLREVGPASMTPTILTRRLEAKYNINFLPHTPAVNAYVAEFMRTDEMQRVLAQLQKEGVEAAAGKKRGRASGKADKKPKAKKEKKEKREKKEKKPEDYPKAALSAYMLFAADFRAEHPELAMKEQMTKAGEVWRGKSDEDKKPYEAKAAAEKARFEKDMEAYLAKGGKVFKRGGKKSKGSKKAKDPNEPKRALSGYMYFAADFRAKNKDLPVKEQMTKAGEAWRGMNEEEKKPYEAKAAADKERYEREKAAYGGKGSAKAKAKPDSKDAASSSSSSDESDSDSSSDSGSDSDE